MLCAKRSTICGSVDATRCPTGADSGPNSHRSETALSAKSGRSASRQKTCLRLRFCRETDNYALVPAKRMGLQTVKTRFPHQACALRCRNLEPTRCHHQHVEACQKSCRTRLPIVIDESLVHDEGAARCHRLVRLGQQHSLRRQIPVVQHPAKDQHVSGWQTIVQKIARVELQSPGQTVAAHVPLKGSL